MTELLEKWNSNVKDYENGMITRQEFNERAYNIGAKMKAIAHAENNDISSMLRGNA